MKLDIIAADLVNAVPGDPHNCVLVQAIRRQYPEIKEVTVSNGWVNCDGKEYKHTVESLSVVMEFCELEKVSRLPRIVELRDA